MELNVSLNEHLLRSVMLHSRLCPRQVLGVRMARLACILLNVDPALDRKPLYVFMEIGRCTADAVIVVTGASPTNGLMQLMGYGKVAATFIKRSSGQAIRISEHQNCREIAVGIMPTLSAWEAQRDAYQIMPDEQLFHWQSVCLTVPLPVIFEKHAVTCQHCGDRVNEHCEVMVNGHVLCKACVFSAYFVSADVTPHPLSPDRALWPDHPAYSG